ncbi:MAG: N-6 DNA methylase [Parvibaculum sp.]|uniref:type I restriction-modification system subunit M n=1 Tax=Parvibaculum sp. TaxID=2024848 RepID=UPI00391C51FC
MTLETIKNNAGFIWSIAEILRGDFKQSEYGKVILPFTVLRRLDCILEGTKQAVLDAAAALPKQTDDEARNMILATAANAGGQIYNESQATFASLRSQTPSQLHSNLIDYISGFSPNVREVFLEKFRFTEQLKMLADGDILYAVFERFAQVDLHPDAVSNLEMGYLFEELIRRFSEISNETAGEHFTPREIVRLIVELVLANDSTALSGRNIVRRVYDPACGTGGMLSIAEEEMTAMNDKLHVELFGQELNPESYAICKSDMLVKGHDASRIAFGNTLVNDAHKGETFHYMVSNPPYGVDWKKYADPIKQEAAEQGFDGRFGAGLPRVSDGQLLFLQHMVSKMRDDETGSRIGIVMNGSPLFTGGAGSGESEIRRWLLEKDLVEAIIALPTDLFYNTGIQTYVWLLNNRKSADRRGKVQLIDASGERFWTSMRKSLGSKRREVPEEARKEIVRIYHEFLNGSAGYDDVSKIFSTSDFGYREIRIERPLRLNFQVSEERLTALESDKAFLKLDENERARLIGVLKSIPGKLYRNRDEFEKALAKAFKAAAIKLSAPLRKSILTTLSEQDEEADICTDKHGSPEADPQLRDHELVPLNEDWRDYVKREVLPFVPDAWVNESYTDEKDGEVGRVGYEINFNRYFYQYVPPRPLEEINAELKALEAEIAALLKEAIA